MSDLGNTHAQQTKQADVRLPVLANVGQEQDEVWQEDAQQETWFEKHINISESFCQ